MTVNIKQLEKQKVLASPVGEPKLRFPGFSGAWKEEKLGEIAEFWNGKAHEQDISTNGKYIVVNSKFISQNGDVKKYSDSQLSPLKKDDIAVVMSDIPGGKAIGKCFLVDKADAYTLNQRIGGIKSKEIISPFLIRILSRNKYFIKFDNGVSQTNLRKDEILKCPVIFPSVSEQQKIADFLESVDKQIENLRTQKDFLNVYKKGIMQIRFKDEGGKNFPKWEEKKLKKVVIFSRGSLLSKTDLKIDGKYKCIHYGELFTEYEEIITNAKSRTDLDTGVNGEIGDILMPTSDVTPQGLAKASSLQINGVKLGGDINILRPNPDINSILLSYLLNCQKKKILKIVSGSTVRHVYSKDLGELKYYLSSNKKEQQKIADFLISLDSLIKSKQQQITEAEQWKKGLMQGLFVQKYESE